MYTKIYEVKSSGLAAAKIAASYITEELGGLIAKCNLAALNVLLCKDGTLYITINFDTAEDMKAFQVNQLGLFEDLRKSLNCETSQSQAVAVFRYEREAAMTEIDVG